MTSDGSRVVTANRDGTATVWDVSTALNTGTEASAVASGVQAVQTLGTDTTAITSMALSPDGTRLATGNFDGTVRVWDLLSGQELYAVTDHTSPIWGVAFSPDGSRLVSGSWDSTVRVYAAELDDLTTLAHSRLTRTWTTEECQRFLHMDECPPAIAGND